MAEIIIPVIYDYDQSGMKAALEASKKLQEETEKFGDVQKEAFEEAEKTMNDYTKAVQEAGIEMADYERTTKDANKENKNFSNFLKQGIRDINVFGVNIGQTVDQLKAKRDVLRGVATGLGTGSKAAKVFGLALKAIPIFALIAALTSLISFFTRTKDGVEAVRRVVAGLSAGFDVLVDRVSLVGRSIVKVFSGDFAGAINDAKEAVTGLTAELAAEISAAVDLERRAQRLTDAQRELRVEFSKQRAEIELLREASLDEQKTFEERAAAREEAIKRETELEKQRIALAEENLDIISKQVALGESLEDDLDRQAQAEIELNNIRQESAARRRRDETFFFSLQRQAEAERKRLAGEERKRIAQLTSDYEKLFATLTQQVQAAELDSLGLFDRIDREEELALEALDSLRQQLEERAQQLGIEKDFGPDFERLAQNIRDESEKARDAALEASRDIRNTLERTLDGVDLDGDVDISAQPNVNVESLGNAFENNLEKRFREIVAERAGKGIEDGVEDLAQRDSLFDALERFKDNLTDALGFDGEQAKAVFGAFEAAFMNIFESRQQLIQQEIEAQDSLLDALGERIDEQEDALDRELELKKAGFANDFEIEKANLANLQAEREAAQQKRTELEEKAAKRQAALDSAQQLSSLVTATANIFKGFSQIPILGQILAVAAVAAMFSSFAAAKVNARKATQLREGKKFTGKISGRSHERGGEQLVHRAPDGSIREIYEAEDGEMLIGTKHSKEHDKFLTNLNNGLYAGKDLIELLGFGSMMKGSPMPAFEVPVVPDIFGGETLQNIRESSREIIMQKAAKSQDMGKYFEGLEKRMIAVEKAIKEKPDLVSLPDGTLYERAKKGNSTVTTIKKLKVGK